MNVESAIALSKMFLVNDARLVNITVRGNILPNPDGVIVTRSRARQSMLFKNAMLEPVFNNRHCRP